LPIFICIAVQIYAGTYRIAYRYLTLNQCFEASCQCAVPQIRGIIATVVLKGHGFSRAAKVHVEFGFSR
jgi:hypothetical protein